VSSKLDPKTSEDMCDLLRNSLLLIFLVPMVLDGSKVNVLPQLDYSLSISSVSFVMSHDAASGYITLPNIDYVDDDDAYYTPAYYKTQQGSFYSQLVYGARALDLRVTTDHEGDLVFKHGDWLIEEVDFDSAIKSIMRFNKHHKDEVILLIFSHLDGDDTEELINESLDSYSIPVFDCDYLYDKTIHDILSVSAGRTVWGIKDCAKSNYYEDYLVHCYDESDFDDYGGYYGDDAGAASNGHAPCTEGDFFSSPFTDLFDYTIWNANGQDDGDGGDDSNDDGDDSNDDGDDDSNDDGDDDSNDDGDDYGRRRVDNQNYPLNEIQGIWQGSYNQHVIGAYYGSTLVNDNTLSQVNSFHAQNVKAGKYGKLDLNVFAVDNVEVGGYELAYQLRIRNNRGHEFVRGENYKTYRVSETLDNAGLYFVLSLILAVSAALLYMSSEERKQAREAGTSSELRSDLLRAGSVVA